MSNTEFNFSHNQHQNDLAIVAGKKTIRYSELTQIVNRTANYYLAKGISPKDKIGILSGNTTEFVIACFALWRINAIPIPLNIKLNLYELKKIIIFSDCKFILKSDEFKKILSEFDSISLSASDSSSDIEYENETNEKDTAVIIFTSGTSGSPKGVELTNNNLFESFISINSSFNFSSNDKFLASLPFYHIGGFSMITRALLSGGTLLIPESLKTNDIAESLFKNDPTIISLVSTMLKRLIDNKISPNKNLRIAFIGGGPSDDDLILDSMNVGWPLVKVYGSTETSSMITGLSGSDLRKRPASAGLQFGENIIKIMNDSGNELGIDEVGEICVKGKSITKGYFKDLDLTKSRFRDNFFLTGDIGYIDKEGYLFVESRRRDLIISGGENIDPLEIEAVILEHPHVVETVVFAVSSDEWGQTPIAAVVLSERSNLTLEELNSFIRDKIASYKIPSKLFFVDQLPKNQVDKIQIEKLKKILNLE